MMFQGFSSSFLKEPRSSRRRNLAFGAIVLVILFATLWGLGILGIVHGNWTGISAPIFATTGLMITFFRWFSPAPGAIIVYTKLKLLGTDVRLYSGLTLDDRCLVKAAVITRRCVAYFPALKPGHYTIYSQAQGLVVVVTVESGRIATIDWLRRID